MRRLKKFANPHPPQSSCFGRRIDRRFCPLHRVYSPPQSSCFGRRIDLRSLFRALRASPASIQLFWEKDRSRRRSPMGACWSASIQLFWEKDRFGAQAFDWEASAASIQLFWEKDRWRFLYITENQDLSECVTSTLPISCFLNQHNPLQIPYNHLIFNEHERPCRTRCVPQTLATAETNRTCCQKSQKVFPMAEER